MLQENERARFCVSISKDELWQLCVTFYHWKFILVQTEMDNVCLGWITHASWYWAHLGNSSPWSTNKSWIQGCDVEESWHLLLKSDASKQSVCMWSTDMFVREREMRGQKSSPGEHLQSALPRRPVHTLLHYHTNTTVRLTPTQRKRRRWKKCKTQWKKKHIQMGDSPQRVWIST